MRSVDHKDRTVLALALLSDLKSIADACEQITSYANTALFKEYQGWIALHPQAVGVGTEIEALQGSDLALDLAAEAMIELRHKAVKAQRAIKTLREHDI